LYHAQIQICQTATGSGNEKRKKANKEKTAGEQVNGRMGESGQNQKKQVIPLVLAIHLLTDLFQRQKQMI